MKLILARHGECERLVDGVYNGWEDYMLTSKGINQAQELGEILRSKKISIDKIYTSDLKRTIDTAKIIADETNKELDCDAHNTYLLNERHYGVFQGKRRKELMLIQEYAYIYDKWLYADTKPPQISNREHEELIKKYMEINDSDTYMQKKSVLKEIVPKSESIADVEKRVKLFLNNHLLPYFKEHMSSTVLVVSHAYALKLIVKEIENIQEYSDAFENLFATCGAYIYNFDSKFNVISKEIINNDYYA
ncbi:MAG: 2,3-bisphosphoglycerate-dependent phosphoglycerate mutase [Clostridia bacterium]|nr:2,3-bisphosphoglycerate-dependent phosphoglycerate mutase [Clostridia bacterium]